MNAVNFGLSPSRLWWENHGVFTKTQKASLASMSLARIICDNTGINRVPSNPFRLEPNRAEFLGCNDLVDIDFTPWIEPGKTKEQIWFFICANLCNPLTESMLFLFRSFKCEYLLNRLLFLKLLLLVMSQKSRTHNGYQPGRINPS